MKKIEAEMCRAVQLGSACRISNTTVEKDAGVTVVRLHGNAIFKRDGDKLWFSLAGWNTVTTRSRVNALLRIFGGRRVSTKQGQAMLDGKPIDSNKWVGV